MKHKVMRIADYRKYKAASDDLDRRKRVFPTNDHSAAEQRVRGLRLTHYQSLSDKVGKALDECNGKATAHTYSAHDVRNLAIQAENQLAESGVPLKDRKGCTLVAVSGEATANAYKYSRKVTRVQLVRGAGDWFLTHATADGKYGGQNQGEHFRIRLTPVAKAAIIRRALSSYAFTPDDV